MNDSVIVVAIVAIVAIVGIICMTTYFKDKVKFRVSKDEIAVDAEDIKSKK